MITKLFRYQSLPSSSLSARYLTLSPRYYHFNFISSRVISRVIFLSPRGFETRLSKYLTAKIQYIHTCSAHPASYIRSNQSPVFNFLMDFAVDADGNHQFRPVPPYLIKSYLSDVLIDAMYRRRETS